MRNRAKCRLCGNIIESKHQYDSVSCNCGEISVDGGSMYHKASFKNLGNFICIDDEGNEIIPSYGGEKPNSDSKEPAESPPKRQKPSKDDLLMELESMLKNIERLPTEALYAPVSHADFGSLLILMYAILKCE